MANSSLLTHLLRASSSAHQGCGSSRRLVLRGRWGRADMDAQAASRSHVGRRPLLQIRRKWTVGGVIGNRLIRLDRHGVLEHKRGPEQQQGGTHGAAIRGSST